MSIYIERRMFIIKKTIIVLLAVAALISVFVMLSLNGDKTDVNVEGGSSSSAELRGVAKYKNTLVGSWVQEGKTETYMTYNEDGTCVVDGGDARWLISESGYLKIDFFSRTDWYATIEIIDNDTIKLINNENKSQYIIFNKQ